MSKQKQTGFTVKLNPQSLAALDRWRSKLAFPFSRNAGANFLVKLAAKQDFGWTVTKMPNNLCASNPKRGGEGNCDGKPRKDRGKSRKKSVYQTTQEILDKAAADGIARANEKAKAKTPTGGITFGRGGVTKEQP